MDQSIGDILNGEVAPEPEAVTEQIEAAPAVEQSSDGPVRDEKGRFAPKEPTGVQEQEAPAEPVPPTEPTDRLPPHEYAALKDERRKRQELEQRLQAMEQRLHQPQPQAQQPVPEFWDDPQSFMDQRFSQMTEQLFQQWEQRQQVQRIDASEQAAKAKYADYDDAYEAFAQAVQLNPRLAIELAQAPDPGEFAYKRGKTALEIQRVGSVDQLRAEIRAELEAEARASIAPQRLVLPSTTAADGSVGGRSGPEWAGPKPLGQLLG